MKIPKVILFEKSPCTLHRSEEKSNFGSSLSSQLKSFDLLAEIRGKFYSNEIKIHFSSTALGPRWRWLPASLRKSFKRDGICVSFLSFLFIEENFSFPTFHEQKKSKPKKNSFCVRSAHMRDRIKKMLCEAGRWWRTGSTQKTQINKTWIAADRHSPRRIWYIQFKLNPLSWSNLI